MLNRLFGSPESLAEEMRSDDQAIRRNWEKYIATIPAKQTIIGRLKTGNGLQADAAELKRLLILDLVDISGEEREEAELIADLEKVEHSQKIMRLQRLEQCLGYEETKYEHVRGLLHQLTKTLRIQMHLAERLLAGPGDAESLISHIRQQLELELGILEQIQRIKTFGTIFSELIRAEVVIRRMDSRENRMLDLMQGRMRSIFSGEIDAGITNEWALAVFDAIEDKVHEAVAGGIIEGYHPDIGFQFVNRPEFVELAREKIIELRGRSASEQMIRVFVQLFREWYNELKPNEQ